MIGARAVNQHVRDTIDPRVLPTLKNKATALEQYAASLGILFGFPDYSGWRSLADTTQLIKWRDEAVAAGGQKAYYPVAPYGVGFHGKGAAFDIKVVKWPQGKTQEWAYATLGAYASRIGLRWGGYFSGKSKDIFHYELAVTLAAALDLWDAWQKQVSGIAANLTTSTAPSPKVGTAPLAAAVAKISTPTGAVSLGIVAALALVGVGFFLLVLVANFR